MPSAALLSPQQLHTFCQGSDQPVILDCRFVLGDPQQGRQLYRQGHLPGARHADLEDDLSGPIRPGVTGRHPLPDPQAFIQCCRDWGISSDSSVVLYDEGLGAFAARAWWLLTWIGKTRDVHLLEGGYQAWCAAGLPTTTRIPEPATGNLSGQADPSLLVSADALLQEPSACLLDARAPARFAGDEEPIDPVAGHIPGARCLPCGGNLNPEGGFLAPDALRARFTALMPAEQSGTSISYCGSGVTACLNLFAMVRAGLDMGRLYPGSWSEWITDPKRPIARGH